MKSTKPSLEVKGDMTPEGADKAGNKIANAANIAAIMFGLSSLIAAISMLIQALR